MTSTASLEDLAVRGRRVTFVYHRSLHDDRANLTHPGIITGTEEGHEGALRVLVRLDGKRSNLSLPADYEGITYLDQVVDVPDLPMGPFIPVADDMNGFYELDGLVVTAVGEDGEDLVAITDDRDQAFAAVVEHGTRVGYGMDDFEGEDMTALWVVFEWQPEDAECSWFMTPAAEGDDLAVHVFSLSTE